MNNYHKWTINDGDYVRNESDIHIARPESFNKRFKRLALSVIWKAALLTAITFLVLKLI